MNLRSVSTDADGELVAQLAERCWRHHYTPIIGEAQVDYMLAKFQSATAIQEQMTEGRDYRIIEDREALGYLATDLTDHLFLSKLYVLPEHQGKGVGRWAVEQLAQTHSDLDIHLTVNRHNHGTIAFYEKLGFINDGPVVADIGEGYVMDDWRMYRPAN